MRRTLLVTLIAALLLPAVVVGQSPDAGQLDRLYLKSGLADLVEQIPAGVQAGFEVKPVELPGVR